MVVLFGSGTGFLWDFLVSNVASNTGTGRRLVFSQSSPFFPNRLIVSFFASLTLTIGGKIAFF